jgi:hypothetical protein
LADNLTTRGSGAVNANYASRELLLAAGLTAGAADADIEIRRQRPLQPGDPGMSDLGALRSPVRLNLGGAADAYTLRARAELTGGRARRTVAAIVAAGPVDGPDPIRIVRWYETAW